MKKGASDWKPADSYSILLRLSEKANITNTRMNVPNASMINARTGLIYSDSRFRPGLGKYSPNMDAVTKLPKSHIE